MSSDQRQAWFAKMMEAGLAVKFPDIKTYLGRGVEDPSATVRLDVTPKGFHAMVFSPQGTVFVDPYSNQTTEHYITYYKKDFAKKEADRMVCHVDNKTVVSPADYKFQTPDFGDCGIRHEYRLALACSGA